MVSGRSFIAAEVVSDRKRLIRVKRIRPITSDWSASHYFWAVSRWTWSSKSRASQTLTSGKLSELIDLFRRQVERLSTRRDDPSIQREAFLGSIRLRFVERILDAVQNQLASGATLARRG